MFAVVDIAGTQVKVSSALKLFVPKLQAEVGTTLKFDKVILKGDDAKTSVGAPFVAGSYVEVKVLRHMKDDKVRVFKKKKRKGYRVDKGHRQQFTEVEVTKLV